MTSKPISDLYGMLKGMDPLLHDLPYVFMSEDRWTDFSIELSGMFASVHEDEGTTYVFALDQEWEMAAGLPRFARITLQVHSDLEGVGLTAAASTALAGAGIACNVIAAFHHDHLFVPWDRRDEAVRILSALANDADR